MPSHKLRSMLMAPKGKTLVMCDLSQAETWIVAHLSNDPKMKWALTQSDIHYETANGIFEIGIDSDSLATKAERMEQFSLLITYDKRYTGKRVNHASAYRMSAERFAQVYNKDSAVPITIKQSKLFNAAWHNLYPNIKPWWSEIETKLNATRTLTTPYGRKRMFFQAWGQELFKEATAYVPQSTVADHFNGAFQRNGAAVEGGLLHFYKNVIKGQDEIKIINQSHDSAMLEVPTSIWEEIAIQLYNSLRRPMIVNGTEFTIPVDCELGERWGEMEKVKLRAA